MSQGRDIELELAYDANRYFTATNADGAVFHSNLWFFAMKVSHWDEAIEINNKYVVLARYDENQYSSPPNMVMFGIFSSKDKAKSAMSEWAINRGLSNEFLDNCEYEWVLIDEVNV